MDEETLFWCKNRPFLHSDVTFWNKIARLEANFIENIEMKGDKPSKKEPLK